MKQIIKISFWAFMSCIVNTNGFGQTDTNYTWTRILPLIGRWQGKASLTMEEKQYSLQYFMDYKTTSNGSGLVMDEWFNSPELGKLAGTNLIGYNANDKQIHWASVDNFGTTHTHTGYWKKPDLLYLEAKEMMGKSKFLEKINIQFLNSDQLNISLVATVDGKIIETIQGVMERINQ